MQYFVGGYGTEAQTKNQASQAGLKSLLLLVFKFWDSDTLLLRLVFNSQFFLFRSASE